MNSRIKVLDEYQGCPYCYKRKDEWQACCGEVHSDDLSDIEVDGEDYGTANDHELSKLSNKLDKEDQALLEQTKIRFKYNELSSN